MRNDVSPPPLRRSRLPAARPVRPAQRWVHHLSDVSFYDHPLTEHLAPASLWLSMALLGLAVLTGVMVWVWVS